MFIVRYIYIDIHGERELKKGRTRDVLQRAADGVRYLAFSPPKK